MNNIDYSDEDFPGGHQDHPYLMEDPEVISMLEQAERESDGNI